MITLLILIGFFYLNYSIKVVNVINVNVVNESHSTVIPLGSA